MWRDLDEKTTRWTKNWSLEPVNCDNQAAISTAKNDVHHDRTKHVEVDRHFKEKIKDKIVTLNYIPSHMQTVDILTKAIHRPNFEELCSKLDMYNIYSLAWGGVLKYWRMNFLDL